MKNIIEIESLSKCFDKLIAVNHISFTVKQDELFAFLGTNGAGKSTTISMICTLLAKTSGRIVVDGFDSDKEAAMVRSCLGVVFQNNVLDGIVYLSFRIFGNALSENYPGGKSVNAKLPAPF